MALADVKMDMNVGLWPRLESRSQVQTILLPALPSPQHFRDSDSKTTLPHTADVELTMETQTQAVLMVPMINVGVRVAAVSAALRNSQMSTLMENVLPLLRNVLSFDTS